MGGTPIEQGFIVFYLGGCEGELMSKHTLQALTFGVWEHAPQNHFSDCFCRNPVYFDDKFSLGGGGQFRGKCPLSRLKYLLFTHGIRT